MPKKPRKLICISPTFYLEGKKQHGFHNGSGKHRKFTMVRRRLSCCKQPYHIHIFIRVEKYRPATLSDLISHEEIISTSKLGFASILNSYLYKTLFVVSKFISLNQLPHLLFYGPPGTGSIQTFPQL